MGIRFGACASSMIVIVSLLLGAFLCIAPSSAVADQEGDYIYSVSDGNATVTGYTGIGGSISIPSSLGGYAVVAIGASAFEGSHSLTSVTIPDSVTSIDEYAFYNCNSITSVTIPDSVTSIRNTAFWRCSSLMAFDVGSGNLNFTSVDGVLYNKAMTTLYVCPSAKAGSFVIPGSVKTIGDHAFLHCESLTSLTIPGNVTYIANWAFQECRNLTSIDIPSNVTAIGIGAFNSCTALTTIDVNTSNPNYASMNGVLYNKTLATLITYPSGRAGSFTIPDTVTTVGIGAFYLSSLVSVTIPDSVDAIEGYAFERCSDLTSISFMGLSAPTHVNSTWIHATDAGLRGHALAASDFPNPGEVWNGLRMGEVILESEDYAYTVSDGNATITGYSGSGGAITIPSTMSGYPVTAIGDGAFDSSFSLTSVTMPDGIASIGAGSFASCINLTSVDISDGVTSIGDEAFAYCNNLTSIDIPNNVTSIGRQAFNYCSSLSSVTLGSRVMSIGTLPFYSCTSLTAIDVDTGNPSYASIDGVLYDKSIATLLACPEGRTGPFTVPDDVETIGGTAFYHCTSLISVTIPSNVTAIGDRAFGHCTNLTSISFLGLVAPTSVGEHWILDTNPEIRGHAYSASNFSAPGSAWNGLMMGEVLPGGPEPPSGNDSGLWLFMGMVAIIAVLVLAFLLFARSKSKR